MNDIIIIIPAFNEVEHIEELLTNIKKRYNIPVLVVDDGSTDGTLEIARKYADYVLEHIINMGKGKSIMDGLKFANDKFKYALLMDADGQHSVEDIKKFLKNHHNYSIIVGSRDMNIYNMPLIRYIINRITTLVTSILANRKVYDSQSGYRLVNIKDILSLNIKTLRFQMESEMLIRAGLCKMRIGFVKVKTIYGNEVSKINPIIDTIRFVKMALETLWQ